MTDEMQNREYGESSSSNRYQDGLNSTFDLWQLQDEVRTSVDACARCGIWNLSIDRFSNVLRLELDTHLDEEQCDELCSQFPTNGYYEGEGLHGSQFTIEV